MRKGLIRCKPMYRYRRTNSISFNYPVRGSIGAVCNKIDCAAANNPNALLPAVWPLKPSSSLQGITLEAAEVTQ